jgi:hypothetical protein
MQSGPQPEPRRRSDSSSRLDDGLTFRERLYRYFFYAWLFRDADAGSSLERSAALRHNLAQAKWLPLYLLRWSVGGALILLLERLSERMFGDSLVSAVLAILLIFVVMFDLITGVCWAFLQVGRQSR